MFKRTIVIFLIFCVFCLKVLSISIYEPLDVPIGLQIGKRFISGPLIIQGGNETIVVDDEYVQIQSLTISDEGITIEPLQSSNIYVNPSYQFSQDNTSFNITIYCEPIEPIKAFEFKISFNKTIINAINVSLGNFFDGYEVFFNGGEIQNDEGRIINIYGLILGQGNVTEPGSLVIISFNITGIDVVSFIHIYEYGVTNETEYLPLQTTDGNVQAYGTYRPWDINEDNKTNYLDLSFINHYYGQSAQNQPWDIVINGVVDFVDVSAMVTNYGKMYS